MKAQTVRTMASLILAGAFIGTSYAAPPTEPLGIKGDIERKLNRRLYEIAQDPSFMTRLDQTNAFRSTEEYAATLADSLAEARKVLPEVFSAANMKTGFTAVCMADRKVFFWISLDDHVLVGWIPIITRQAWEGPLVIKEDLIVWLVPLPQKKTKLIDAWQNRATGSSESSWLADVLKKGLGVDLTEAVMTNQNKTTLHGRMAVSCAELSRVEHLIAANVTEHLVQVEVSLRSTEFKEMPGKWGSKSIKLDDIMKRNSMIDLPFIWPPNEE